MKSVLKYRNFMQEILVLLCTKLLTLFVSVIQFSVRPLKRSAHQSLKMGIEAGTNGWRSIYFEELSTSAKEYFGDKQVSCIEIVKEVNRIEQLKNSLDENKVTHLIYDPRTNNWSAPQALFEALKINIVCYLRGIKVLATLTDPSLTLWRLQSAIVTKNLGRTFTPMDVSNLGFLRLGMKIDGPFIMPVSKKTLTLIQSQNKKMVLQSSNFECIKFRGTLYPTRLRFYEDANTNLKYLNSKISIDAKNKSEFDVSSEAYWLGLAENRICITTTFQYVYGNYHTSRSDINQMVFRISESLAARNLLFVEKFPGSNKYFTPGEHFVEFSTSNDLAEKLVYFANNLDEAERILSLGHERMSEIILNSTFWKELI